MTNIEKAMYLASLKYRLLRLFDYHEAWSSGNFCLVLDIWEEALDDVALGKMITLSHKKRPLLRDGTEH